MTTEPGKTVEDKADGAQAEGEATPDALATSAGEAPIAWDTLSLEEQVRRVVQIYEEMGNWKAAAARTKKSQPWVRSRLAVPDMPTLVQQAIYEERLPLWPTFRAFAEFREKGGDHWSKYLNSRGVMLEEETEAEAEAETQTRREADVPSDSLVAAPGTALTELRGGAAPSQALMVLMVPGQLPELLSEMVAEAAEEIGLALDRDEPNAWRLLHYLMTGQEAPKGWEVARVRRSLLRWVLRMAVSRTEGEPTRVLHDAFHAADIPLVVPALAASTSYGREERGQLS